MGFIPPLNLGGFQPSPATLAQWVYQIWQYLQENPIATQEQIQEFIGTFITTSPTVQEMIGEGVDNYLVDNPPAAPVQSVQGKTGAVVLNYPDIVPASNAVPVYKASSTPSTNTLTGQYNLGYRLFVNTTTQEIYTISPAGALSLVGRGNFDGTTVDLNSTEGDTTIAEAITSLQTSLNNIDGTTVDVNSAEGDTTIAEALNGLQSLVNNIDIRINATTKSISGVTLGAHAGRNIDVPIDELSGYTHVGNVSWFVNGTAGILAGPPSETEVPSTSPRVFIYNTSENQVTFSSDTRVVVVSLFKRISTL